MATAQAEYELVLMLDPEAPDDARERIAADARKRIEDGGNLKHDSAWGTRKMAYEILQRTEADYRFFRFETAGSLLNDLDHNLKIADGVLRFRIFKVDPRSPVIVPPAASPMPSSGPRRDRRGPEAPAPAAEAPAEAAPEAAPEADAAPEAEAPAEEQPAAQTEREAPEAPSENAVEAEEAPADPETS